ncbi:MAG: hypothetical protein K8S16_20865 [Bacteroidales bacterium]|nr:hypothetical protein [Bacteroidales bacterium]
MPDTSIGKYKSPLGTIIVEQSETGITSLVFSDKQIRASSDNLFFQDIFTSLMNILLDHEKKYKQLSLF